MHDIIINGFVLKIKEKSAQNCFGTKNIFSMRFSTRYRNIFIIGTIVDLKSNSALSMRFYYFRKSSSFS